MNREHWTWSQEPWVLDPLLPFATWITTVNQRSSLAYVQKVIPFIIAFLTVATVGIHEPMCKGVLAAQNHNGKIEDNCLVDSVMHILDRKRKTKIKGLSDILLKGKNFRMLLI